MGPPAWTAAAIFFGRIVNVGQCDWSDLVGGGAEMSAWFWCQMNPRGVEKEMTWQAKSGAGIILKAEILTDFWCF